MAFRRSASARTDVAPALHADAITLQACLPAARIVDTATVVASQLLTELLFSQPQPMGPLVGHQRDLSLPTSACEKGKSVFERWIMWYWRTLQTAIARLAEGCCGGEGITIGPKPPGGPGDKPPTRYPVPRGPQ